MERRRMQKAQAILDVLPSIFDESGEKIAAKKRDKDEISGYLNHNGSSSAPTGRSVRSDTAWRGSFPS